MKTKPPSHLFMELTDNETISQIAAVEAGMTFLKIQDGEAGAKYVYIYPEIVQTREEMFLFAMEYGKFLDDFRKGRKPVPQPVKDMYLKQKNAQN